MGTKNNPGAFDCYANAGADEPMFILLARDAHAPRGVEQWAADREFQILLGIKPKVDIAMVSEARQCAEDMRAWRKANRPSVGSSLADLSALHAARSFHAFGDDTDNWNLDTTGDPGIRLFADALQVWATCQHPRQVSVALAAETFNVDPRLIIDAVEWHPWMFLTGPTDDYTQLIIEHEGE